MTLTDFDSLNSAPRCSLKEASFDTQKKKWMTESDREVIHFDQLKESFAQKEDLFAFPDSVDAVFDNGEGKIFLVEFKNGFIDKKEQMTIRKKIYDSVLILLDETRMNLPDFRECTEFILVYNDAKNITNEDAEYKRKQSNSLQDSKSLPSLIRNISNNASANKEYVCFGLKMFANYLVQTVHTYNQKEFERFLAEIETI